MRTAGHASPSTSQLRRRGAAAREIDRAALEYFQLHIDLDVEHGKALEESMLRWATTDGNREDIRRGARRSLEARAAFWSALSEQLLPDRPPASAIG